MEFIDLYSEWENRKSHLKIQKDSLKVGGNLPHGYTFTPNSIKDAKRLIEWLDKWIIQTEIEADEEDFNNYLNHPTEEEKQ